MEHTVKVDRQGRLVLPASIRETLGLRGGGRVSIRQDGSRMVIEPVFEDLKERVEEWRKLGLKLHVEPFTEEVEDSWKWVSREYARRKLGLR